MRKFLFLTAALVFMAYALPTRAATVNVEPNALIKASGPAVYYYAPTGKRLVFPTEKTYASWYGNDYSKVITISDSMLSSIPLGGNVTYRPGAKLIKITTDPKVYAVSAGGKLRWIKDEAMAVTLYGADWAKKIDDVPDAFFTNYQYGANLLNATEYSPAGEMAAVTAIWQDKAMPTPQEGTCASATGKTMTHNAALLIAQNSCHDPSVIGLTDDNPSCNTNSGTWWFNLRSSKTNCSPACVVNADTGLAEINWRCTGAMSY